MPRGDVVPRPSDRLLEEALDLARHCHDRFGLVMCWGLYVRPGRPGVAVDHLPGDDAEALRALRHALRGQCVDACAVIHEARPARRGEAVTARVGGIRLARPPEEPGQEGPGRMTLAFLATPGGLRRAYRLRHLPSGLGDPEDVTATASSPFDDLLGHPSLR